MTRSVIRIQPGKGTPAVVRCLSVNRVTTQSAKEVALVGGHAEHREHDGDVDQVWCDHDFSLAVFDDDPLRHEERQGS
jgi:hypothetical protein